MVDLQKTTDETQDTYNQFAKSAAKTASEIGSLTLNVIQSTSAWTKLGYTLKQSAQLAKETAIFQNVGDISNADDASSDLISAIKGFNIEVDDQGRNVTHLVDVYNEVGRGNVEPNLNSVNCWKPLRAI